MKDVSPRPLYGEFAWAYDAVIARPVGARCGFIAEALAQRSVVPPANLLDAGCGTGGYAIELARRGFAVTGLDASAALVLEAGKKLEDTGLAVTFEVRDILGLPSARKYDGILCRGVLNDILDDRGRRDVFVRFARALRRRGALLLDVREWDATARRKAEQAVFERCVDTDRGRLTFRSITRLHATTRRLLVRESYTLLSGTRKTIREHDFVMRCWTKDELCSGLTGAGFRSIEYFGDYDSRKRLGSTDRIAAVATLGA